MSTPRSGIDPRSEKNLAGVHPDLQRVVRACIASGPPFLVTEGLRTVERQKKLVESGASKTMNSRHLTGHAIDVAALVDFDGDGDGDLEVRWDWPLYARIAQSMKGAARAESVPIVWGGDWPKFRDGPHFELDRRTYP